VEGVEKHDVGPVPLLCAVTSNSLSFQLLWLYGRPTFSSLRKFIGNNVFYPQKQNSGLVWPISIGEMM
jgi:hypothetical protein